MARIIVPISSLGDIGGRISINAEVARVAKELQTAIDEYYRVNYPATWERGQADKVTVKPKKKYINIDIGSSGAYMVDTTDGTVYGIKGYGVPHKGVVFGNIADVDGEMLLRGRHARSGSIRPASPRKRLINCTFCESGAEHDQRLHNLSIEAKQSGKCYCGDGGVKHCDFCTGTREMSVPRNPYEPARPVDLDAPKTEEKVDWRHVQRVGGSFVTFHDGSYYWMNKLIYWEGSEAVEAQRFLQTFAGGMTQDERNDADYKMGWQAGLKMLREDREGAYRWERDVYAKAARPSWIDMGKADVITEHRIAKYI